MGSSDGRGVTDGGTSGPVRAAVMLYPHPQETVPQVKSVFWAYVFAIPLGLIGAHHFYLSRPKFGVCYLFTGGLLGVGWLIDLFRMQSLVDGANRTIAGNRDARRLKNLSDAYVLWFPLGVIGFHHYYLGRMTWGIAYTLTFGMMGFGWLIDLCRMPSLVRAANERLLNPPQPQDHTDADGGTKSLSDAYLLCATPFGLLGAHHYYMENWFFGITYTFTLGLMGFGWLTDWCSMPVMFKRSKAVRRGEVDPLYLHLDEAYKLYFPLGVLGLHRFYLRQPCTGLLFLLTFGGFLVGWVIDAFLLPGMVKKANKAVDEQRRNMAAVQHGGVHPHAYDGPAVHVSGDIPQARPYVTPQQYVPPSTPAFYYPASGQHHYPHQVGLQTVAILYPGGNVPPPVQPTSHFVPPSAPPSYTPYVSSSGDKAAQAQASAQVAHQPQPTGHAMDPPPYSSVAPLSYSPYNQRSNKPMEDIGEADEEEEE